MPQSPRRVRGPSAIAAANAPRPLTARHEVLSINSNVLAGPVVASTSPSPQETADPEAAALISSPPLSYGKPGLSDGDRPSSSPGGASAPASPKSALPPSVAPLGTWSASETSAQSAAFVLPPSAVDPSWKTLSAFQGEHGSLGLLTSVKFLKDHRKYRGLAVSHRYFSDSESRPHGLLSSAGAVARTAKEGIEDFNTTDEETDDGDAKNRPLSENINARRALYRAAARARRGEDCLGFPRRARGRKRRSREDDTEDEEEGGRSGLRARLWSPPPPLPPSHAYAAARRQTFGEAGERYLNTLAAEALLRGLSCRHSGAPLV